MPSAVVISDKDGGRAVELRENGDLPVFINPSGDAGARSYWNENINISGTGDFTVHTPASGKKFYVTAMAFSLGVSGEVQMKSGTTAISGPMNFDRFGGLVTTSTPENPVVMRGRAVDNTLILSVTNPSPFEPTHRSPSVG